VDEGLLGRLGGSRFVGSLDELVAVEGGAGADEGNEVGCVDRAPTVLGGLEELEGHSQASGLRAGAAGELAAVADGGEGGFNRVSGAQMDPVLGGVVVEGE
jgi:hypothetical protein